MSELKNCPFCGGNRLLVSEVWASRKRGTVTEFTMKCVVCGANCGYFASEEDAITAWNTRV